MDAAWFDGVFGNYEQVFRLVRDDKGGATQLQAVAGQWQTRIEGLMLSDDGTLASDATGATNFSLRDYKDWSYLIVRAALGYKAQLFEFPAAQKLKALTPLSGAWARRLGKSWVLVNGLFEWFVPGMQSLRLRLDGYPELPGYVVLWSNVLGSKGNQPLDASADDMRAMMCLKIPMITGRDLNDVLMLPRGNEEWLQYGSWLARPLETIPSLSVGTLAMTIGPEGHAEWFNLAEMGSLDVTGASHWMLLSVDLNVLATGDGPATGLSSLDAAYLLIYGRPGTEVNLRMA